MPDAQSVDAIFSAKKLAETLEQNPLGARFEPKEDKLSIASSGEPSDIEADKDVTTRQMHEPTRLRADELAARALRLANQPAWQGLSTTATNFRNLLNQDTDAIAAQVGIVWAELVSLGSYVEQDNEIKENPKADVEPLAPDIRRPLTDLVQSAGPWLRRFPTARRLDEEHAAFQTPKNRVPAAIKLITDADDREVVDSDDASIIQAALEVGQGTGRAGVRQLIEDLKERLASKNSAVVVGKVTTPGSRSATAQALASLKAYHFRHVFRTTANLTPARLSC